MKGTDLHRAGENAEQVRRRGLDPCEVFWRGALHALGFVPFERDREPAAQLDDHTADATVIAGRHRRRRLGQARRDVPSLSAGRSPA